MLNRGGSRPAGWAGLFAGLVAVFGATLDAGAIKTPPRPRRTIAVEVVADSSLRNNESWKVDIFCAMRDVSQALQELSGIRLTIKAYHYWTPRNIPVRTSGAPRPQTLGTILSVFNDHVRNAGRGGCELVVALVPEGPDGPVFPGIADYLMGTVMVKYLERKEGIKFVLLHEICHIFGAVDLKAGGSVMSLQNPGFRIDDFTKSIIEVNRQRSFRPGECPLTEEGILAAIGLYRDRQSHGLGETELDICLNKLQAMKPGEHR